MAADVTDMRDTIRLFMPRRSLKTTLILLYLIAVASGIALALFAGADTNWDLQNYHVADPTLLLRGDYFQDVAPAGMQTYFMPFATFPAYFSLAWLGVDAGRIAIVALHAVFFSLTLSLLAILIRTEGKPSYHMALGWPIAAAVALGLFAPITFSIFGTSFYDITVSIFLAAGVFEAMRVGFVPSLSRGVRIAVLLALAVGLKGPVASIAFIFGATFYAFLFGLSKDRRAVIREFGAFALVSVLVTAAFVGPWSWLLWREFQNPIFPFLNDVFRSPYTFADGMGNKYFVPKTIMGFVTQPWRLAEGGPVTTEIPARDIRFALFFYAMLPTAVVAAAIKFRAGGFLAFVRRNSRFLCLFAFFLLTFFFWQVASSAHRYVVFLDVLLAVIMVRLSMFLPGSFAGLTAAALASLHLITMHIPDWNSAHVPFGKGGRIADGSPRLENAMVFLNDKPMGYVTPYFGKDVRFALRFVGYPGVDLDTQADGPFGPKVEGLLHRKNPEGVWVLTRRGLPTSAQKYYRAYGLEPTDLCFPFPTWFEDLRLCRLLRPGEKRESPVPARIAALRKSENQSGVPDTPIFGAGQMSYHGVTVDVESDVYVKGEPLASNIVIDSSNPTDCAKLCIDDQRCTGFTMSEPGVGGVAQSLCHLMKGQTVKTEVQSLFGGVIPGRN